MIVLFDFDGTILPWDTQKLFCHHVLRAYPWRRMFLLAYLPLLPFASILGSEGLKRVFLSFLWRLPDEEVARLAKGFAEAWIPSRAWPEMLATIRRHRHAGDYLILVSASPEIYVKEVGRILGFDLSLGTEMGLVDHQRLLFPDLINNKGHNKVERLRKVLDSSYFNKSGQITNAHGYTDSCADLPMLTLCQTATVINPNKKLLAIAESNQWEVRYYPRPWKNTLHRYLMRAKYVLGL
jgi:HAD superfamily hydrolase (TIGR01490 family)